MPPPIYSRYHDGDDYNQQHRGFNGDDEQAIQRDRPNSPNILDPSFNPYNLGYDGHKIEAARFDSPYTQHNEEEKGFGYPYHNNDIEVDRIDSPYTQQSPNQQVPLSYADEKQINVSKVKNQKHENKTTYQTEKLSKNQDQKNDSRKVNVDQKNDTKNAYKIKGSKEAASSKTEIHREEPLIFSDKMPKIIGEIRMDNKNKTQSRDQISPKQNSKNLVNNSASQPTNAHISNGSFNPNKETPLQTINRILGDSSRNQVRNHTEIKQKHQKPLDTIHNILGNSLDQFFKDSDRHNDTTPLILKHRKDRLDEFFKKTQIAKHEDSKGKYYYQVFLTFLIRNQTYKKYL